VTSNYSYDPIYELTQVTQGTSTTESYSFDPVGNRTASLGVASYTTNTSNELTATSNASYTHDYNGNTLTKVVGSSSTSYTWDFENRLTSVVLPGSGGTISFAYDPFGRRIEKVTPSTTSIFAYDGDNLIEEANSSGTAVARYSQGLNIDEPLAMLRSSATSFYNADGLGSITSLGNAAGTLAQTYTFDSFGNQTASSGSLTNPFQYTAREFDPETGLYYYRARYYDPIAGRFLGEDPTRFVAGFNFYTYTENDPANYIDSWGLCPDDVRKILNAARNAVNDMTLNGQRIYGGALNNLISSERRLNPFTLPPYKGCGEQMDNVINKITPLPLDCRWEPRPQYTYFKRQQILPHQWVIYQSNDPTDPTIALDPWNNRFQIVPPGSKMDYGANWHTLVPYVGNALHHCCGSN